MGIELHYARLSPEHYQSLLSDTEAADEFFYGAGLGCSINALHAGDSPTPIMRHLSLGKSWDMMHFVYTGHSFLEHQDAYNPLHFALQGGHDTPFECSHGNTLALLPPEVLECAQSLAEVIEGELIQRFRARGERDIYPGAWCNEDEPHLIATHRHLLLFFQLAVREDEMVLISYN